MTLALSKRVGGLSMAEDLAQSRTLPDTGLLLIGMGLGTVAGMTTEAIEAAKKATHRRYEAYTALWPESELNALEQRIGPIQKVMRPEVEQPDELLQLAKTSLVALLVVGDPLQATTHVDLQLQAIEHGIECEVFHGVSITTVVTGAIGLSNYKFGRQTTLTYPYGGWIATSPLEMVAVNRARGLHSLVLFDLDPTGQGIGDQKPMSPRDAKHSIELMWTKLEEQVEQFTTPPESAHIAVQEEAFRALLSEKITTLPVVLCSDMGTPDQSITSTTVEGLEALKGGRLNCLVIPATTSEVEDMALLRWKKE
ncbi:MAG: diphthine synthase [Deltaproteobacteria bacterium]|nr:diphthine synthase [Deltaproteobacteria bacterium]